MKKYLFNIIASLVIFGLYACDDNEEGLGNPEIIVKSKIESAFFGDSLEIIVDLKDDAPLFNFYANVLYGDETVYGQVVKTDHNGEYKCKVYFPLLSKMPDGKGTIELVLQNKSLTRTVISNEINLKRPDFPYITFVTDDVEYKMERVDLYQYEINTDFPDIVRGHFKTPKTSENGNEINIGLEDGKIRENSTDQILFAKPSDNEGEKYTIFFNSFSLIAYSEKIYTINGEMFIEQGDNSLKADMKLSQGKEIEIEGIENYDDWWIDPDFFETIAETEGKYNFLGATGNYRISLYEEQKHIKIEALNTAGNDYATLNSDGSGAIWIIGEGVGKPNLNYHGGWDTNKALCMTYIGNKKHQISFVAGESINIDAINFKFFHQKGWGGEFGPDVISSNNNLVFIGNGSNGRDNGNLGLKEGIVFEAGATYIFTVDLSAGNTKAVLTVEKK